MIVSQTVWWRYVTLLSLWWWLLLVCPQSRERKINPKFSCIKFIWDPRGSCPRLRVKDVRAKKLYFPALCEIGWKFLGRDVRPDIRLGVRGISRPKNFMFRLLCCSWQWYFPNEKICMCIIFLGPVVLQKLQNRCSRYDELSSRCHRSCPVHQGFPSNSLPHRPSWHWYPLAPVKL